MSGELFFMGGLFLFVATLAFAVGASRSRQPGGSFMIVPVPAPEQPSGASPAAVILLLLLLFVIILLAMGS